MIYLFRHWFCSPYYLICYQWFFFSFDQWSSLILPILAIFIILQPNSHHTQCLKSSVSQYILLTELFRISITQHAWIFVGTVNVGFFSWGSNCHELVIFNFLRIFIMGNYVHVLHIANTFFPRIEFSQLFFNREIREN